MHRIYIDISLIVSILTSIKTIDEEVKMRALLTESVIVGEIPSSYYNLNGLTQSDAMQMME